MPQLYTGLPHRALAQAVYRSGDAWGRYQRQGAGRGVDRPD